MTTIGSDVSLPLSRSTVRGALHTSPLARLRTKLRENRRKRAIYLRTLRELRSYQPHELNDLRIHSSDFEALARKQAACDLSVVFPPVALILETAVSLAAIAE